MIPFAYYFVQIFYLKLIEFYCVQYHFFFDKNTQNNRHIQINITLIDKTKPVAIAEGEKNAIFGALYYPQYNRIMVGSIEMLNVHKLNSLKDYQITFFPDKGKAFEKWKKIIDSLPLCSFRSK